MDFQFDPFGQPRRGGQTRQTDGFFGVHSTAGVRQEQKSFWINEFEDVGEGIFFSAQISPTQSDGHELRPAGDERLAHRLGGREFASSYQEAGLELSSGDDQRSLNLHLRQGSGSREDLSNFFAGYSFGSWRARFR